jgi:hypothetical protein
VANLAAVSSNLVRISMRLVTRPSHDGGAYDSIRSRRLDVVDVNETLSKRVQESIRPRQPALILSTTGTQSAVYLLAARIEVIEEAMRELAATVEELQQSRQEDAD